MPFNIFVLIRTIKNYLYILFSLQFNKQQERTKMSNGKIKWFNPDKGYGFIENDAGGKDVFLHVSALEQAGIDTLQEGEAVSFEISENRGKENAINITKI